MKKIILLVLLTINLYVSAQSQLFLKINKTGDFIVEFANQQIRNTQYIYRFFDINSGNNLLRIKDASSNYLYYEQTLFIENNFKYVVEMDNMGNLALIEKIPCNKVNWYTYYLKPSISNNTMPWIPQNNNNGHCNSWGNLNNVPPQNNSNNPWFNNPIFPNHPDPWGGHNEVIQQNNNNFYNSNNPMSEASFNEFIKIVKATNFDNQVVEKVKFIIRDNYLSTNQVETILRLITFDSYKLEIAKVCYSKTVDKNNYFNLFDEFTFDSYSKELQKFMSR